MNEFKVISIEELKKVSEGEVVPLEGFYKNEPFVVRLKRPSLLNLVASKQIPNKLLNSAYSLFYGEGSGVKSEPSLVDNAEIYTIVAKAAMIQPTFGELETCGITLTDSQLIQIWQFSQFGLTALNSFREKYSNNEDIEDK